MMNSDQRPSSRRLSTQQSSGQLLDELEALSQALYQSQAQQKTFPPPVGDAPSVFSHDPPVLTNRHHSISAGDLPSVFDQKHGVPIPRFTSSTIKSKPFSSFGEQQSDIRSRKDRRASLQINHIDSNQQAYAYEGDDWPDVAPDHTGKMDSAFGDKKKGFWSWKPLRALSHIGRQRFHCMFSAYVQVAKGLPSAVNGLRLSVHVRKEESREGAVHTMASRVFQGVAEFEETLFMKCTVYGSRGRSNSIKFMPKVFILSVMATDVEGLELGKHQIDLSRLLPQTVDQRGELEKGNNWNASLELSGKAKGGKLIITFGYEVLDKDSLNSSISSSILSGNRRASMQDSYSLPNSAHGSPLTRSFHAASSLSPSVSGSGINYNLDLEMEQLSLDGPETTGAAAREQWKLPEQQYPGNNSQFRMSETSHHVFGEREMSVRRLSQEEKSGRSAVAERGLGYAEAQDNDASDSDNEFTVVEQGMEIDEVNINMEKIKDDDADHKEEIMSTEVYKVSEEEGKETRDCDDNSNVSERKETVTYQMVMKTLDSLLQGTSAKERAHQEMLDGKLEVERNSFQTAREGQGTQGNEILTVNEEGLDDSLDKEVDLVEEEFLEMLEPRDDNLDKSSESEYDSPRAQLLKEFEHETFLQGGFILEPSLLEASTEKDSSDIDEIPLQREVSSISSKPSFSPVTNNTSTQNKEKDNVSSSVNVKYQRDAQRKSMEMKGNTREEKTVLKNLPKFQEPEPLGKGLGGTISVKDGGTLRSMNPVHFQSEKYSAKLVMQVSKPIVLPAEMGSGTLDILRNMAAMGIENMALQARTAMPLEELMGKSVEQIAMEGLDAGKSSRIRAAWGNSFKLKRTLTKSTQQLSSVIDDNKDAHVALENIPPAAMHQLEFLAMNGLKIQAGVAEEDAPYALHAFSIEHQASGSTEGNSVALKGVTGVRLLKGAKVPAQTAGGGKGLMDMAITLDEWMLLDAGFGGEAGKRNDTSAIIAAHSVHQEGGKKSDPEPRRGCMGNTLTLAMLVQFRDPSRVFEAIGVPMIALIQAERVTVPKVSRINSSSELEMQSDSLFKITGIHMAGLRIAPDNKRPGWGSQRQFRAASRWLLANGMSENRTGSGKSKAKQGNCLWSLSAQLLGSTNKWKDLMKLNPHVRNPDVLY